MTAKRPLKHIERVACLAYYLTHYRDMPEFKTKDLTALNREARQPTFSSASMHTRNALNANLLAQAGKGARALAPRGEALVEALPDQVKARAALAEIKMPRRSKKRRRS
jgi:hypothetical protein